jgi:light-regulated signal transduction histidine kinase (bacteriophytochrome)
MTGEGTISTAVEAMKVGAFDYILKPFKLSAILPVLSRALAIKQLRMENAALELELREHATKLEAANRELEAFSYSVSHDLRAPLRAITGFSRILIEDHEQEFSVEAKRLLDNVITGANRMGQLISDLLEFSRLSREPLTKQVVSISSLVQEVLGELNNQLYHRCVDIRIGDLPNTLGDPSLLKQVWINLISNAFKFTRVRELSIIEVGCQQLDGEQIYFVKDNGAGFDMRYAKKLFGVFQRMHSAEEFEGTGIGLSIVNRIVQRHGGRIWADSTPDVGTLFQFTLPY